MQVAKAAYLAGQKSLPRYAHKFSRRDYTCAQLFAILVLRKFFKTDYRGIHTILSEWPDLRHILELGDKVPHFTTPQKASVKLLEEALIRKLLTQTLEMVYNRGTVDDEDITYVQRIDLAAVDSTGFESRHCSKYFTKRRKKSEKSNKVSKDDEGEVVAYSHYPKLGIMVDCEKHLILSILCKEGPCPDTAELAPLVENMCRNILFDTMLADAGYDSEPNHELLRQTMQATSIIPAKAGHPTDKLPKGKWRWLMAIDFDEETYGQRWQIESVMHMLKSRQGAELTARSNATRHREMAIMAVTHNLMIVWIWKRFYRTGQTPF